jgi:hypothetical protein
MFEVMARLHLFDRLVDARADTPVQMANTCAVQMSAATAKGKFATRL